MKLTDSDFVWFCADLLAWHVDSVGSWTKLNRQNHIGRIGHCQESVVWLVIAGSMVQPRCPTKQERKKQMNVRTCVDQKQGTESNALCRRGAILATGKCITSIALLLGRRYSTWFSRTPPVLKPTNDRARAKKLPKDEDQELGWEVQCQGPWPGYQRRPQMSTKPFHFLVFEGAELWASVCVNLQDQDSQDELLVLPR